MIKARYQELCKIFDFVLEKIPTPEVTANNYLHVPNLDPESLAKYNTSKIGKLLLSIKFRLIAFFRILHSICNRKFYYTTQNNVQSDILFVSHITNNQQMFQENDVYFGDLPDQLFKQGIKSSIALVMHDKTGSQKVHNNWVGRKVPRFVLSSSLNFISEIMIYLRQRKSQKKLHSILKDLKIDKTLAQDILQHHLSNDTINALRIAFQVAEITKKIGPKIVITTFEGHAWERLVYYYVRKVNPSIKCLGYQHAAVFKHQHAISRLLRKEYNPNVILTSGLVAKEILQKSLEFKNIKVICIGSPKYCVSSLVVSKKNCCLVVPEGIVSECLLLFKLSLDYARKYPNQKFIWRLHPLIDFERLKKYSNSFKKIPKNICLSDDNLKKDIHKCDSVLYRGSTTVVNAINAGLKPIYLKQNVEDLSIDPIFQQRQGKEVVENQIDLNIALNKKFNLKDKKALQEFAKIFYCAFDIKALKGAIL